MRRLKKKTFVLLALGLVVGACSSSGYTQEEVDQLVAEAVDSAVADQDDTFTQEEVDQLVAEAVGTAMAEQDDRASEEAQAALVAAVDGCRPYSDSPYVTADEGGLVIEGEGDESPGVSVSTIQCMLDELDTPDSVVSRISNTNSTMGLVEGSWGDYDATWSYHPDNGLFIHVVVSS